MLFNTTHHDHHHKYCCHHQRRCHNCIRISVINDVYNNTFTVDKMVTMQQAGRGFASKACTWIIAITVVVVLLLRSRSSSKPSFATAPTGYCHQARPINGCTTVPTTTTLQEAEALICAHGGDGAKAAPNTVEGHKHAVAAGFRCSEVDVALTSDGHLVSVHARELQTLLPPHADTTQLTWPQIRALHYPKGEHVPLLDDVLAAVSGRVDRVVLDVKLPDTADDALVQRMVAAVGDVLARVRCKLGNCTTVWSKHDAWVRAFKRRHAQTPVGFIVGESSAGSETDAQRFERATRMAEAEVVGTVWSVLDTGLVDMLHTTVCVRTLHAAGCVHDDVAGAPGVWLYSQRVAHD